MTTGGAWNVDNPLKPVALFDPNAERDIPFDWSDFLTDIASTYATHAIVAPAPLECVVSTPSGTKITARIRVAPGQTVVLGDKYTVTCRITAADGQVDDQTVYLKMTEL